ncbi:MAG: sensor histidine kinase [Leucobacter sp.]
MNSVDSATIMEDTRADRRLFLLAAGFMGAVFALGVTAQSMLVLGIGTLSFGGQTPSPGLEAALRISVNLATVTVLCAVAVWWRIYDRNLPAFLRLSLCVALIGAAFRTTLQLLIGVHHLSDPHMVISDALITLPVGLAILIIAAALLELNRRARSSERERQRASTRATEALTALQQEELRVRREVADALHGTMQQRLVLIEAELDTVATRLASPIEPAAAAELETSVRDIRTDLDALRERDLRALSAALYPEALDRGLVPATRALTARIPASIPVDFSAEGFPIPDVLTHSARLLLVRVAEEGVSNALRHGKAERISLELRIDGAAYMIRVRHHGLPPTEPIRLSGLARLQRRLADQDGDLRLDAEPHGAILRAWLPIRA